MNASARLWLTLAPLATIALLAGCGRAPTTQHYETLAGYVVQCKPDTGEVVVRVSRKKGTRDVPCQVTRDSELYINDKSVEIAELQPGDAIHLVGYHDANASIARFVVSSANVSRAGWTPGTDK